MATSLRVDDFDEFFAAVNGGYEPFPWQRRFLAEIVDRLGERDRADAYWPRIVDLPTGSGKTSLLDIATFLLALEADRSPDERRLPRRTVFVVDRRVVVDQAHLHAQAVAAALADPSPSSSVVARMADALREYSTGTNEPTEPMRATLLRGGIVRDESWARRPDVPVIISSTVDQVGSRLLFRGYGVSDSMRPIHAGLLGSDTLFLLDEVHLSQPFAETLRALADDYQQNWAERPIPGRWEVVELSATPRPIGAEVPEAFRLSAAAGDFDPAKNETLPRRLRASKPVTFPEPVRITAADKVKATRTFARVCAASASELLELPQAHTVAVVVNRVDTAVAVHDILATKFGGDDAAVKLLTGRMRPHDRERILGAALKDRLRTGRRRDAGQDRLVVVATQCIEAGADFDFDGMVSECASVDSLVQRFGRVDRDRPTSRVSAIRSTATRWPKPGSISLRSATSTSASRRSRRT
jgi:CRISPR-associated endonuclease/helicase Cas3